MVTFRWASKTVEQRIDELTGEKEWRQAKKALVWLLKNTGKRPDQTAYGDIYNMHYNFLEENPDPSDQVRCLWLRFIETEGLECALWPDLFTQRNQTVTHARAETFSRKTKASGSTLEQRYYPNQQNQQADDQQEPGEFNSTKRAFAALALALM